MQQAINQKIANNTDLRQTFMPKFKDKSGNVNVTSQIGQSATPTQFEDFVNALRFNENQSRRS